MKKNLLLLCFFFSFQNLFAQQEDIWKTLFEVKYTNWQENFAPKFSPNIKKLDGKTLKIKGFLIPLDEKPRQSYFLLSAFPYDMCFYCGKAGPESVIEVRCATPIKTSKEPIVIEGKLELNADDPAHLFYMIQDGKLVK